MHAFHRRWPHKLKSSRDGSFTHPDDEPSSTEGRVGLRKLAQNVQKLGCVVPRCGAEADREALEREFEHKPFLFPVLVAPPSEQEQVKRSPSSCEASDTCQSSSKSSTKHSLATHSSSYYTDDDEESSGLPWDPSSYTFDEEEDEAKPEEPRVGIQPLRVALKCSGEDGDELSARAVPPTGPPFVLAEEAQERLVHERARGFRTLEQERGVNFYVGRGEDDEDEVSLRYLMPDDKILRPGSRENIHYVSSPSVTEQGLGTDSFSLVSDRQDGHATDEDAPQFLSEVEAGKAFRTHEGSEDVAQPQDNKANANLGRSEDHASRTTALSPPSYSDVSLTAVRSGENSELCLILRESSSYDDDDHVPVAPEEDSLVDVRSEKLRSLITRFERLSAGEAVTPEPRQQEVAPRTATESNLESTPQGFFWRSRPTHQEQKEEALDSTASVTADDMSESCSSSSVVGNKATYHHSVDLGETRPHVPTRRPPRHHS